MPRDELTVHLERAFLVSVALPERPWLTPDPLDELRGLATAAGALVVGGITQRREKINPKSYIGKGKLEEVQQQVETADADVIIFDNDLSPGQIRNLEKATKIKVLDRSELILDIFATRARTAEARLQVELAQLEYALPRLRQMWTHLGRFVAGGGGAMGAGQHGTGGSMGIGTRGPGETQLETDRRLVDQRIRDLKHRLAEVQARKEREVRSRHEEHTVSLVGYTNAGKSTLMNALTGAGVHVQDQLFSTLDTRTRQWHLKEWGRVLLSDTVGFIRDLPHHLVASFKATLEETRQAKLLLHVVDASNPVAEEQIRAVNRVLDEIGCKDKPTLLVLNKVDKLSDPSYLHVLMKHHPRAVAVSAAKRQGVQELAEAVIEMLSADFADAEIEAHSSNGKLLAYLAAHAEIYRQQFDDSRVVIRCYLPRHLLHHVQGPDVQVRFLDGAKNSEKPPLPDE
ncbi:GTPase HflX [Planctomycetaceae bacterium SCGC AG-212-F19]|nr:GTPase HflX [Planctomycetaceae bacterium SCGC AG-212-F19]